MARRYDALAQSLLVKAQRSVLDAVGERVGTPVAYVKAAWAEPVLYGGRGERLGCDVDALVRPDRFRAFARALVAEGFLHEVSPGRRFASYVSKEWVFSGGEGSVHVDLHRELADAPWFNLDSVECLERAVCYHSVDGPILSLCAEDQVVYAAAHHAQSVFRLDGRHLEDTRRLIDQYPVDWQVAWLTACDGHLDVPLVMLSAALRGLGVDVPVDRGWLGRAGRARLRIAEQFVATDDSLRRRRTLPKFVEYMTLMPAASGRASAWARYVARFTLQRSIDRLDRVLVSSTNEA